MCFINKKYVHYIIAKIIQEDRRKKGSPAGHDL